MSGARVAHLVGSIPAEDADEAMALARDNVGGALRWLPDGETGDRYHWVVGIVDGMRAHPDLEIARDGDWSDYDKTPRFKVRKGHTLRPGALDFGHVAAFRDSYPAFERTREALGDPGLSFQVGIPGDFDMGFFVLGPVGAMRTAKVWRAATAAEIRTIHAEARDDVVFQVEVPVELVLVAKMPGPLRRVAASFLARRLARLGAASPSGARFGLHLCLGDMNHKALATMRDLTPVVLLANAVAARWPADRLLEYVHAPVAGASQPPPTAESYYAPLVGLRLPAGTRFVAGFVYEHQSAEEQRRLLALIERLVGRRVDVSASCGLGRRSREEAVASMVRARELAQGP